MCPHTRTNTLSNTLAHTHTNTLSYPYVATDIKMVLGISAGIFVIIAVIIATILSAVLIVRLKQRQSNPNLSIIQILTPSIKTGSSSNQVSCMILSWTVCLFIVYQL